MHETASQAGKSDAPGDVGPNLSVSVLGAAGYVGGEVLRLLVSHPHVASLRAFSESHADQPWSAAHPTMLHLADRLFETPDIEQATASADVIFLALPHGESQNLMSRLLEQDPRLIVDLSADFRVQDAALYDTHYGRHLAPDLIPHFRYALADVERENLAGCRALASPGCFATAHLLALWPLASAGLLPETSVCFAATGSSGSGATPKSNTHHPTRAQDFHAYALAAHRHEAEIQDRLRCWTGSTAISSRLLTHSAPMVRGISATVHLVGGRPFPSPLAFYREAYAATPFVKVTADAPHVAHVCGTNYAHIHAVTRGDGREMIVTVAIDNMIKGAAGQAIQAMNLALRCDPTAGLRFPGIHP